MMKKVLFALLAGTLLAGSAGDKPVGVWHGNSWPRLGELFYATAMNPQWTHDKPARKEITAKNRDFDSFSAIVYLHGGGNPLRFREWKKEHIAAMEKYVADGGLLIVLADGALSPNNKNGDFSKLLGAKRMGEFTGKAEIKADDWKQCGEIPQVFEHMLSGNAKRAALTELTTAKMLIGNQSGALVAENRIGKGRVLFINVRLTESLTPYNQPYNRHANAALEQLFPFMKKIHAELMTTSPALMTEKRELWDYKPLGPKAVKPVWGKPPRKKLVSPRKYEKLSGDPIQLIVDGQAKGLIITQKTGDLGAAQTLNALLKKMSGTELPIAPGSRVTAANGKWKWRGKVWDYKIEFPITPKVELKVKDNLLSLGGPSQSQAVYSFMREALGYRMLWPGDSGEVYKKTATVSVEPFELTDAPMIRQRSVRNSLVRKAVEWKGPDEKIYKLSCPAIVVEKNDLCGFDPREVAALRKGAGGAWWHAHRLGGGVNSVGGGSFYNWQKRFGKTHPEYMALQFDGTRHQKTNHIRICKANPAVVKQAAEDARAILNNAKNRNVESYNLSPSDGGYDIFCMCPLCRAWDPTDAPLGTGRVFLGRNRPVFRTPGKTDRVFRFTCEVARELKKTHPKVKVKYLAYAGYLAPPKYYRDVPDNIMVTYVGMQYLNDIAQERDRSWWDFWAGVSSELILRPNFLGTGAGLPLVYVHEMGKDLRYCAETGMIGGDFDSLGHNWATLGLNYYVLAEMLWDPSLSVDAIIDEYCSAFGPAAGEMKAYFALCEKLTKAMAKRSAENIRAKEDLTNDQPNEGFFSTFCKIYSDEQMKALGDLLEKAKEKTAPDSPERKRVEFIEAGYRFTKNRRDFHIRYHATKNKRELKDACAEQWKQWHEIFVKYPYAVSIPSMAVGQYYGYWRQCGWKPGAVK